MSKISPSNHDHDHEEYEQEQGRGMERHAQTIITGLILAGVLYLGNSATQMQATTAEIKGDISLVKQSVKYLEDKLEFMNNNSYSASDAEKDLRYIEGRIINIETRIKNLEEK